LNLRLYKPFALECGRTAVGAEWIGGYWEEQFEVDLEVLRKKVGVAIGGVEGWERRGLREEGGGIK